jgi:arabinoxylan arabinofuranohydrolase
MNTRIKRKLTSLLWVVLFVLIVSSCNSAKDEPVGYLFAYFVGNGPGQEQVHYALSKDGYNYRALNNNQPVIDSKTISHSGGVRDPHILRGEDGHFYMVLTDLYVPDMGWENTAMVLLKSPDLINWSHSIIDIPQSYPENFGQVNRVWAPQTIYDPASDKYMIYWSMRHNQEADIIYYAYANEDFTDLAHEPKQLLYKKGACIDGDIVRKDGKYHFFFKNEDEDAKGIMKAVSDKINEGYQVLEGYVDQTEHAVEGSGTFKLIGTDRYILMYDVYMNGKYQFCESEDLENFKVIDSEISMNFHPRHGSVIPITQKEMDALLAQWGQLDNLILGTHAPQARQNNVIVDNQTSRVYLPVHAGTNLLAFDPEFELFQASLDKTGPQDFSQGPVPYTLHSGNEARKIEVTVAIDRNPVLDGYYADPEIIFSRKDGKYYLYPTSDGFHGWSGKYFETFSSNDLINWTPEGKILDLTTDVSWADRNAWAPTAIEREIDNEYKYFYYFTAAQKIGVAISDSPTGPFKDSGKPLIDFKPKGVKGGQEIDPDVFRDPKTGKYYLYWGNGYMAVAELNNDMVSIKKETIKVLTPDETYREGTEIFYRNGKYYFMWSEDDTRSPNYRVRYAFMDSPTGPLRIPENNLVIAKDEPNGIYGTGHNSVINAQGTDDWFIVYHRFTRPKGIEMGNAAGFHRETCIDQMTFDEEGNIQRITPTLGGVRLEKKVFEVRNPDKFRSPYTGMTRQHWIDAAHHLLKGAFSYVTRNEDPMKFPKLPGKSYPHDKSRVPTEKLEGLCRTLFVAAPLLMEDPELEINGVNVADYYRYQITQLFNPQSGSFIPHRAKDGGPSQNLVEFGALAISLTIAPHVLWDPLTPSQKDKLAAVMLSYGDGPTVPSNWRFFNIFVLSFFKDQGYPVNEELLVKYLQESLDHYRGQGWYNDAPAYDYYSMWAFQMYGTVWAEEYGNKYYPELAAKFMTNFTDLIGNYPYLFSKDGKMIMYGRSISYRIGSIVPFPLMGFLDDPKLNINYGWMRRISSAVLLQFMQHPDFMEDGVPTLGFYGHFEPATQNYSCRGSVYWMGKAFVGLLVPEDNPFWTATENEGDWSNFEQDRVYNKYQPASEILITDYPNSGASEIRAWCHEKVANDWQKFRSSENYNKLAYNSNFLWQADGTNGEVAMNYAFLNQEETWEVFRLYDFQKFESGAYHRDATLETNENIKMSLIDIPVANGILRIDTQKSTDPVKMRLGHYALPKRDQDIIIETKKVEGNNVTIIDNGTDKLAMVALQGWEQLEVVHTSGLHPDAVESVIINATSSYDPIQPNNSYVSLMLWKKSGNEFTKNELSGSAYEQVIEQAFK